MLVKLKLILVLALLVGLNICGEANGQCPTAALNLLPDTVCVGKALPLANASQNATNFEWDFCAKDLGKEMGMLNMGNLGQPELRDMYGLAVVQDTFQNWFAFATNRNLRKLFRLSFGQNIKNPTPTVTQVPEYTTDNQAPSGCVTVKEGKEHILFWGTEGANLINRIRFPNGFENAPIIEGLPNIGQGIVRDIAALTLYGQRYLFLSGNTNLTILSFGGSYLNEPTIIQTYNLPGQIVQGVEAIHTCDTTSVFVGDFLQNPALTRFDFVNGDFTNPIAQTPVLTVGGIPGQFDYTSFKIIWQKGEYYAFAQTNGGVYYWHKLGTNVRTNELNCVFFKYIVIAACASVEPVFDKGDLSFFFVNDNFGQGGLARLDVNHTCSAIPVFSTEFNPTNVQYSTEGMQYIQLKAIDPNGNTHYIYDSVYVRPPLISSVDFEFANACVNQPIFFENRSVVSDITQVQWQWTIGNYTSTEYSPSYTFNQTGSYTITLRAIDIGGCEYTTSQVATVFASPQAEFSYQAGCGSSPVIFQDHSDAQGDEIIFRKWELGNGEVRIEPGLTFSHLYGIGGQYEARLIVITTNGCTDTVSHLITIPRLRIQLSNRCVAEPITFTADTAYYNNATITNYFWDFGDGFSSNAPFPVHTYNGIGNYQVRLQITTAAGCTDTARLNIVVGQKPIVDYEIISSVCAGSPAQFRDKTFVADYPIAQWNWNFGDGGNSALVKNPTYVYTTPGIYPLTLTVITQQGCQQETTGTVNVAYNPVPDFELPTDYCLNKKLTLIDKSTVTGSVINGWYWLYPTRIGNTYSTLQAPVLVFDSLATFPIVLTVTSALGCKATVTKSITTHPAVIINFTAQPDSGIFPLEVKINNTVTAAQTYQWLYGDNTAPDNRPQPGAYIYTEPGTYLLTLVASNPWCAETLTKRIVVTEPIVPHYDVAVEAISTLKQEHWLVVRGRVRNKSNVPVTNLDMIMQTSPANALLETWRDTLQPGEIKNYIFTARIQTLPPDNNLDYVCVKAHLPLSLTDVQPEDNEFCTALRNGLHIMSIGPNPTQNNINIEYIMAQDGIVFVDVFDVVGRRMIQQEFPTRRGSASWQLFTETWAAGLYTIRIHYDTDTFHLRFLKSE